MKISNSKKQLAEIIHENGGWRDGYGFSAQDGDDCAVWFYEDAPVRGSDAWWTTSGLGHCGIEDAAKLPNWHQTILSRDEYFHLYPTPDADGWIEHIKSAQQVDGFSVVDVRFRDGGTAFGPAHVFDWSVDGGEDDIISCRLHKPEQSKPEFCESVTRAIPEPDEQVWTNPPTIEQLAADYRSAKDFAERKQQEADAAKADADEMLRVLEIAGEALGLLVSPITERQEPELVITDWRDLQLNDIIEYVDGSIEDKIGMTGPVVEFAPDATDGMMVRMKCDNGPRKGRLGWPMKWRFIRRP